MKKNIIKFLLIFTIISSFFIGNVNAKDGGKCEANRIKTSVSVDLKSMLPSYCKEKYCCVPKEFSLVMLFLGKIIQYFTFIASLAGVLFIVINGIMYSMGGAEASLKDDAKKRITATLIGLVLLFMSGLILHIIAPWIYTI